MSVQFNSRIGWTARTQPDAGATPVMLNQGFSHTLLQDLLFLICPGRLLEELVRSQKNATGAHFEGMDVYRQTKFKGGVINDTK